MADLNAMPVTDARSRDREERQARPTRIAALVPVATVVVFLGVWELAVRTTNVPSYVMPSPTAIFSAVSSHAPLLWANAIITIKETLLGFAVAVAVAIPLAITVVQWPVARQVVYPVLILFNSVPKIALAPIVVIWFGFGDLPKTFIAMLSCFFPVFLDSASGLASTPADHVALMRSLKASPAQVFWKLRFPYALPQIFVGLKVGVTFAVIGAVTAEFVQSSEGLGYIILVYSSQLQTAFSFGAILSLAVISVVLFNIIEQVERLLIPWAEGHVPEG